MKPLVLTLAFAVAVVPLALAASIGRAAPSPSPGAGPVVIELFQSQGCSSCPPALGVLEAESHRSDVIALNFAVTYWDYLGWKDKFAQAAFTQRQRDYADAGHRSEVFTPELVIGGATSVVGSDRPAVDGAIRAAAHAPRVALGRSGNSVSIGAAPGRQAATLWLVDYDPRSIGVAVRAGENAGRLLGHRNIVTRLTALGSWTGAARVLALPQANPGQARVALLQQGRVGPVLAAIRL